MFEENKQNGNIDQNILTGYTINLYNENTEKRYVLCMDDVNYGYDWNGRLVYIADEQDNRIQLTYTDNSLVFSCGSGADQAAESTAVPRLLHG